MSENILQMVLDYVFGTVFIYLAPIILVITILLFSEQIIDVIYQSVGKRRGRY